MKLKKKKKECLMSRDLKKWMFLIWKILNTGESEEEP